MKVIRKSEMIRNCQEGHLRAERDFLVSAEGSRWIVPLLAAFQDDSFLYLVMDFCIGGDFLGLLIRRDILSEDVTKWYIAEMILCVEEAHRMRWIHRDVKPDNFLIGADGHLKISDFGLAFDGEWQHDQKYFHEQRHKLLEKFEIDVKGDEQDQLERQATENSRRMAGVTHNPFKRKRASTSKDEPALGESLLDWRNRSQQRKLARSVVGTSQYMAPEIVRGDAYDGRCDWWSIGIILYECLYGFTPFACEHRQETKLKILKHCQTLQFPLMPDEFCPSQGVVDLISRLLVEKEYRLSSRRYELNDWTRKTFGNRTGIFTADKGSQDYAGNFVYPDDAQDIKNHPWFDGVPWESLHLRRPPFVPRVRSWEDTKYFDDDEVVSDIDATESEADSSMDPDGEVGRLTSAGDLSSEHVLSTHHQPEAQHIVPSVVIERSTLVEHCAAGEPSAILEIPHGQVDGLGPEAAGAIQWTKEEIKECTPNENPKKERKDNKRPRDKILRDVECAVTALRIRKNGSFLGYSYRRPRAIESIIQEVIHETEISPESLGAADGAFCSNNVSKL